MEMELKAKQEAEAKAAEELRAKLEADAKVAEELRAKQEAETKAAEELKAKVESETKAAEELKAKQEAAFAKAANQVKVSTPSKVSSSKTVVPKKVTITCIKGKLVKKVTATNPKCPVGYKKK